MLVPWYLNTMGWELYAMLKEKGDLYEELIAAATEAPSGRAAYEQIGSRIRELIPDSYHLDYMHAAAELLVWATELADDERVAYHGLDTSVLDLLARQGVWVGGVLENEGPDPEWEESFKELQESGEMDWDQQAWIDHWGFFELPVPYERKAFVHWLIFNWDYNSPNAFLKQCEMLADLFRPRGHGRGRKPTLALMGLRPRDVVGTCDGAFEWHRVYGSELAPEPGTEDERHCGRVFEAEIAADTSFVKALHWWTRWIRRETGGCQRWTYRNGELTRHSDAGDEIQPFGKNSVERFCRQWCLDSISTEGGSLQVDDVWITAERLSVVVSLTGVRVFIPRYYGYSDIQYRSGGETKDGPRPEDFVPLKKAMASFSRLRMQQSTHSRIETAKRVRAMLKKQGSSRRDAWEQARVAAGMSTEEMIRHCGEQPQE